MLYRNITLSANITEVESVETVEASLWLPVWFISHCVITVILILSRFVRITIIMSFSYLFFFKYFSCLIFIFYSSTDGVARYSVLFCTGGSQPCSSASGHRRQQRADIAQRRGEEDTSGASSWKRFVFDQRRESSRREWERLSLGEHREDSGCYRWALTTDSSCVQDPVVFSTSAGSKLL